MPTELFVYGPFDIPYQLGRRGSAKRIDQDCLEEFWTESGAKELAGKQGCYIFALRAGKGYTPWYVEKPHIRSNRSVCMITSFLGTTTRFYSAVERATQSCFFVAMPGTKRKIPKKTIDNIETYLIQSAFHKNPDLSNIQKTKDIPNWGINGVVRMPGVPATPDSPYSRNTNR